MKLRDLFIFGIVAAAFASLVYRQKQYTDYMDAEYSDLENPQKESSELAIDNASTLSFDDLSDEVIMMAMLTQKMKKEGVMTVVHPNFDDCYLCSLGKEVELPHGMTAYHSLSSFDDRKMHSFYLESAAEE